MDTSSRRHRRRQPHPVRPLERAVRARLQPGHAHRRPRRAGRPLRAAGRAARRGRRRRGAQAQPRLQPHPRVGARLARSSPTTPAYDVQQACGTGLETAILVANKIALGQIESAIAGGVDTTSDAPIAVNEDLRQVLLDANRAKSLGARLEGARRAAARASSCPSIPQQRRAAHRPVDGRAPGDHHRASGASPARRRTSSPPASHQQPRRRLRPRLLRRPDHAVPRPDPRPEPARRLVASRSWRSSSRCSARPATSATMTAGNSTPLTDGAVDRAARPRDEWAAEHKLPVLAHFVDAETAAVDYVHGDRKDDGLLMAPVYAVPRLLARNGLTLQDFDFYEIHEAFAVDRARPRWRRGRTTTFCQRPARPGRAARLDRPRQAQRQRLVARGRSPVRRDRRADRRRRWPSCCTRTAVGPRADLDLRRRRPGRRRDPGGGLMSATAYLNLVNSAGRLGRSPSQRRAAASRRCCAATRAGRAAAARPGCCSAATSGSVPAALDQAARRGRRRRADASRRRRAPGRALVLDARRRRGAGRPRRRCASSSRRRLQPLRPSRPGDRARSRRRRRATSRPTRPGRRSTASSARWPRSCARGATANLLLASSDDASLRVGAAVLPVRPVGLRRRAAAAARRRRRAGARRTGTSPLAGKTALVTGAARGHRRGDRRACSPATARTSSPPTCRRPARRWRRSPTGSAAPRCSSTSRRPTRRSGCSTHLARAHRRPRHRRPQRRHHPRQAAGQHEARAVGRGDRGQPRSRSCAINAALLGSEQLQRRRRASSACRRPPGSPATAARPTTRATKAGVIGLVALVGRRRSPSTATRRSTRSRPASSTPR